MNGFLYDLLTAGAERRHLGRLRGQLLADLRGRIVDVGAGTGANFAFYASGAHVIALEPDAGMLRRARSRASASRATIDFVAAGDEALDALPAASIDAVVYTLGLCTIADPERSLHRAKRVLTETGTLVILEHVRGHGFVASLQDAIAPVWGCAFGGCRPNQETRAMLRSAGFDVSAVDDVPLPGFSPVRDLIAGTARPVVR